MATEQRKGQPMAVEHIAGARFADSADLYCFTSTAFWPKGAGAHGSLLMLWLDILPRSSAPARTIYVGASTWSPARCASRPVQVVAVARAV